MAAREMQDPNGGECDCRRFYLRISEGHSMSLFRRRRGKPRMSIGSPHLASVNALCLDGPVEWQLQVKWHLRGNDHRWWEESANFYPFRFK